jgi:FkbM family methyltransferase
MESTTTLTLVDGVRIVVPDSLNLITSYVLREQQDWFEDEIKFLRRLLQPGQKVIDIGANYGVYALSMARTVGPTGCVWAFEPASGTARLLAEGIAANGFTQVVLDRRALSSAGGTAQLSLNENSELNSLIRGAPATGASETVPVSTLDECLESHGWQDIAFMKIDAEGEEANILRGGKRFFAELSPLVQYEVKAGTDWHMELVEQFAALGYASYRLVPGLDLLVPFSAESTPDGYLLNLFCCKQDRGKQLAADGYLLDSAVHLPTTGTARFRKIWKKFKNRNAYNWRQTIAKLPYGAQLTNHWERTMAAGNNSAEVDEALSSYGLSRDSSLSSSERFAALEASFGLLKVVCERQSPYLRLASLARVARDYGARSLAVYALQQLCNVILEHKPVDLGEPFLAPAERFDSVSPGKSIGDWVLAAALEELERLGSYSSFYTGPSARQRLEIIRTLGFGSAEMERRSYLLQQRFGLPAS